MGWTAYRTRQFPILSLTRPLFEHLVLNRVHALPGVEVRDGSRAVSLRGGRTAPWEVVTADGTVHDADLVVDATGRGSRLPTWLEELGHGPLDASGRVLRLQPGLRPGDRLMVGPKVLFDPRLLGSAIRSRLTGARSPNLRPQIVAGQTVAPGSRPACSIHDRS